APSTVDVYTLSLHDALPIFHCSRRHGPEGQLSATRFLRHESAIERDGNSNNRVVTGIEAFQTPDARRWRIPLGKESRGGHRLGGDRKSTRLNSSHSQISYAV